MQFGWGEQLSVLLSAVATISSKRCAGVGGVLDGVRARVYSNRDFRRDTRAESAHCV